MSKDSVYDWDTVPENNADIAGIGIRGTSDVRNFDNAFRTSMAQIAAFRNGITVTVASRTELKALNTAITTAVLKEAGREGLFSFISGDYSAEVAADTQEGIYVEADGVAATSGAWVRLYTGPLVAEWFGAVAYSQADLEAALGVGLTVSTTAMQAALDMAEFKGGAKVIGYGQFYILDGVGLKFPPNVYFEGAGHGVWAVSLGAAFTWEGTNLIFKGAGTGSETIRGVTSMKEAGGVRVDPDDALRSFSLSSLMNDDATGSTPATPKNLAVAVTNSEPAEPWGISNCRIVPWIGTDGISTYNTSSGSDLGDEWDIGLLINDTEQGRFEDVQVRGYWREHGCLMVAAGLDREGRSEGNILRKVSAQGLNGLSLRGGDIWEVQATTASTLEVLWTDESYWPSSGAFEGLQNGTDYTYTSLSRNGANLVFNGVSPDPSGTTQIRNPLRGTGFSTTLLDSCEGWPLYHHSGQTAEDLGLGISKGGEFSGFPLRGVNSVNSSWFGEATNSICCFFHDNDDLDFIGGKFEIGHLIASPQNTDSSATAPAGSTDNLRFNSYTSTTTDRRLFTPRSKYDPQANFNPRSDQSDDMLIVAEEGQAWIARLSTSGNFIVESDAGVDLFTVTSAGNANVLGALNVATGGGTAQISAASGQSMNLRSGTTSLLQLLSSGTVAPGASGNAFGTTTLPWGSSHAQRLLLVDGVTAPSATTGYATLYVDSADGDLKIRFGDGTIKTIATDT